VEDLDDAVEKREEHDGGAREAAAAFLQPVERLLRVVQRMAGERGNLQLQRLAHAESIHTFVARQL
jgi:hypothetical protein